MIRDADVYHLTPPPVHHDPTGWMALQYDGEQGQTVVLAYRLGQSEPQRTFTLRGKRAGERLPLTLEAEWRAAVVELPAQ